MKKWMCTTALLALALAGCGTEQSQMQPQSSSQSSVIAVTSPEISLTREQPLSWFGQDFLVVEGEDVSAENRASYDYIKQRIRLELEAKGLQFAPAGQATERQVVVAAILGDGAELKRLQGLFRLYPNLSVEQGDFPKGTLLVAVIDPEAYRAAWRGAIQVAVDQHISETERMQRIDLAVQRLLRSLDI